MLLITGAAHASFCEQLGSHSTILGQFAFSKTRATDESGCLDPSPEQKHVGYVVWRNEDCLSQIDFQGRLNTSAQTGLQYFSVQVFASTAIFRRCRFQYSLLKNHFLRILVGGGCSYRKCKDASWRLVTRKEMFRPISKEVYKMPTY